MTFPRSQYPRFRRWAFRLFALTAIVGLSDRAMADRPPKGSTAKPEAESDGPSEDGAGTKKKHSFADLPGIQWTHGPGVTRIGSMGEIRLSDGYIGTESTGAQKLLQLMQNPTNGSELAFVAPA